jgi:hypothetical protein
LAVGSLGTVLGNELVLNDRRDLQHLFTVGDKALRAHSTS